MLVERSEQETPYFSLNPAPKSYVEMTGRVSYLAVEGHAFRYHHLIITRVEKLNDGTREK